MMLMKLCDFMSNVKEACWYYVLYDESYVYNECDMPSLREFTRSTMVGVVVWDATFTLHQV